MKENKVNPKLSLAGCFLKHWDWSTRLLRNLPSNLRGFLHANGWARSSEGPADGVPAKEANPLRDYFNANIRGPGIWKWDHYFDIYHRHLKKFVGREMTIMEIGIYSGGSLGMWRHYFGNGCRVYGMDIEPSCKIYENEFTRIFIGDQADRQFWAEFRSQNPLVDVLIDDGGHMPEQQRVTLEEMLTHVRPGGVYICEDIHGVTNEFGAFVQGLAAPLNAFMRAPQVTPEEPLIINPTGFQKEIYSIHLYPYMIVIEKNAHAPARFVAAKHGTEWQPFIA